MSASSSHSKDQPAAASRRARRGRWLETKTSLRARGGGWMEVEMEGEKEGASTRAL
jgi:hypothetical protein